MPVAEEYCTKRNTTNNNQLKVSESSTNGLSSSRRSCSRSNSNCGSLSTAYNNNLDTEAGEWKLINFYEWFFKLAELVNKNFVHMWNDGYANYF